MERRTALAAVASLVAGPAVAQPYSPYGPATDYRILDLGNVREIIIRLPKGNITITTDDIWKALQD
jgi:hypothetical protein